MRPITRDVVADLWPLYETGEASADTKAIVDEFLAADPEFAGRLRASSHLNGAVTVPPDVEVASLKRTRDLVKGHAWLRGLRLMALVFTIFSISRVVSDTSWDVSPRVFIVDAILATTCWTAYGLLLHRYRRRALGASN
jgi:hypothetical protein